MKTTGNSQKAKAPTKGQMICEIEQAISKVEGLEVKFTPRAIRTLSKSANRSYLERAHRWAWYILNWKYGERMSSDSIYADYEELMLAIELMFAEGGAK